MKDLMIDLETVGTGNDAVVISIGAVFFDSQALGVSYYSELDPEEQQRLGRKFDWKTVKWWVNQSAESKGPFNRIEMGDAVGPALRRFKIWVESIGGPDVKPWGNGCMFDISILESLMFQYSVDVPWKYSNVRDLRTFREEVAGNEPIPRSAGHHNALTDAKEQALYVIKHRKNK